MKKENNLFLAVAIVFLIFSFLTSDVYCLPFALMATGFFTGCVFAVNRNNLTENQVLQVFVMVLVIWTTVIGFLLLGFCKPLMVPSAQITGVLSVVCCFLFIKQKKETAKLA